MTACAAASASAQTPQLVFTVTTPERAPSPMTLQTFAAVEERGLALWGGSATDFGAGVAISMPRWTIRSISSMTAPPVDGYVRPTFQQVELVRPVFSTGSMAVAGGGGIRQEWDGTRVFIGRVLAGSDVGRGRLQGSLVLERAVSSPVRHDAADLVTSVGWSRRVGGRFSVGAEGIGQDLEGFWAPAEADGGAKLLVGPSVHAESATRTWAASLIAGPVIHTLAGGRHFGILASASWVPSLRR
jgi:hypothetical protein